jgi:hypothetical protein
LAGYLPKEWNGKRVAVRFVRGRGFDARLVSNHAGGITVEPINEDAEEEAAGVRSSLGQPCAMSSCWKTPASARGLDPKAPPPKCRRTPRLSWLRKPSKGFRPRSRWSNIPSWERTPHTATRGQIARICLGSQDG